MCDFSQAYGEGSSYSGFLVRDKFYFGEGFHPAEDGFNLTFGCVQTETHLFYSQAADGILGLTRGNRASPYMTPIYRQLKDR